MFYDGVCLSVVAVVVVGVVGVCSHDNFRRTNRIELRFGTLLKGIKMIDPEVVDSLLRSHLDRHGLLCASSSCWTVNYSKLGGRGLFATRDIQPGEIIFIDAPLIIGPRCYKKYLPMCVNCCKVDCSLFPCERGCGLPVCSDECENSPKHIRLECDYLRSLEPTCDSMWSIDLLQAVVPIRSLTFSEDEKELLYAFECHPKVQMSREVELLKKNVKINPREEEEALMLRVSRVMDTTCFETAITTNKSSASLRALYPLGALQNHSCTPNTRHHFDSNQRVIVSAALPIKKGEEITMTYTDLLWDTALRRHLLKATKHFSCKCERCSDKMERGSMLGALKCAEADCPGDLMPEDPLDFNSTWICGKCQLRISGRQIKSIRSGIGAIVEEMQYKSPRRIQKFIETELRVLVPATNCTMIEMMFRIISLFGRTKGLSWKDLTDRELNIKANYCKELLKILELLGCGACKKKGLILYELYCTNEEKLSRLADRPKDISESDLIDNESILRKAFEILQEDIAAPQDYLCKIRNHENRTFQSAEREGSLSNTVL